MMHGCVGLPYDVGALLLGRGWPNGRWPPLIRVLYFVFMLVGFLVVRCWPDRGWPPCFVVLYLFVVAAVSLAPTPLGRDIFIVYLAKAKRGWRWTATRRPLLDDRGFLLADVSTAEQLHPRHGLDLQQAHFVQPRLYGWIPGRGLMYRVGQTVPG